MIGCRPVEVEPELEAAVAMGTEPEVLVSRWGLASHWLLALGAGLPIGRWRDAISHSHFSPSWGLCFYWLSHVVVGLPIG